MNNIKRKKVMYLMQNPLKTFRKGFNNIDEDIYKIDVQKKYNIDSLPQIEINEVLKEREITIDPYSFLDGTSLISDIVLLKGLARQISNCNYLEIGSWRGESVKNVSEVAEKCVSVTLSEQEMRNYNFGEGFINIHGFFSKASSNIKTYHSDSKKFDFTSLNQKFDLIFIDGDHSYEGVLNDTKKVFDLRKDENSVIVWHDYGYMVEDVRYSVFAAILEGIPKELHHNLYKVSNTMCAVYFENYQKTKSVLNFPTKPNKFFELKIKIESI